jgi:hypothetical protein
VVSRNPEIRDETDGTGEDNQMGHLLSTQKASFLLFYPSLSPSYMPSFFLDDHATSLHKFYYRVMIGPDSVRNIFLCVEDGLS